MKKYRFRKMYFICADKRVIEPHIQFTAAIQHLEYAKQLFNDRGKMRESHYMWEDEAKPLPVHTIEGFYLVHESLFDEVLKPHIKD